ncbi:ShlB/FhaC/HecB family hemolysin secretion/activation protein [Achromobacter marplatensis]|jgi:hemolysin activation/secretion protein|uniref:ShlB/FhaC/HecB family hemolysin secretion/activation protein n=1 Tax=Achromobacter marplatensis TaxID=470868 RepID=UPI003C741028
MFHDALAIVRRKIFPGRSNFTPPCFSTPGLRWRLTVGLLLSLPPLAAPAQVPDAGRALRELESTLPAFAPPAAQPSLDVAAPSSQPSTTGQSEGPGVLISGFQLRGNQVFEDAELLLLLADLSGTEQSLDGLRAATDRITEFYQGRGYLLARAYLPPQEIVEGVVQIAIQEGVYDSVTLNNQSRVSDAVLQRAFSPLRQGDTVHLDTLDNRLMLVNDMPGIQVQGTLRPGKTPGSTDLFVDAEPGPLTAGSLDVDNFGGYYTGEFRMAGTLDVNSPLRLGDQLNLRLLTSDKKQRYYRAAYQVPVGPHLTRLGVSASNMRYRLGRDFDLLDAHGKASIVSLFVQQPLLRSRHQTLQAQLQYDDKSMRDAMDLFEVVNRKHVGLWTASLNGSRDDGLMGGGRTAMYLSYGIGSLQLRDPNSRQGDRLYTRSAGRFGKANITLLRLQNLPGPFMLSAQLNAQLASKNLDSSEKFSLGGPFGVRAFPNGAASGDEGWQGNLDLRYLPMPGLQLGVFLDKGAVRLNKRPWTSGRNSQQLSAMGVSLIQSGRQHQITLTAAWPLEQNNYQQEGPKREPRLWFQATRLF